MEVSNNSMNAAMVTVTAISHGLTTGLGTDNWFAIEILPLRQSADANLAFHRHARPEIMLRVLAFVQANPNGKALDNLHVVAAGVFRRKETEQGAGGTRHVFHLSLIITVKAVGMNGDGLTRPHATQLGFLEVCGDPDIVNRNDGQQRLTGLHPVTKFDGLVPHHS